MAVQEPDASGAAGLATGAAGARAGSGADTGVAAARGDVTFWHAGRGDLQRRHGWALALALALAWLWLWLWSRSWEQEQSRSRSRSSLLHVRYLHRSGHVTAPATAPRGVLHPGAAGSQGYPAADPPHLKGCRARAPAGRAVSASGIGGAVHIKNRIQLFYRCWGGSCCHCGSPLPWRTHGPTAHRNLAPSLHGAAFGGSVAPAGHRSLCSTWHPRGFGGAGGQFKLMGLPC